jgi:hypothetical protein
MSCERKAERNIVGLEMGVGADAGVLRLESVPAAYAVRAGHNKEWSFTTIASRVERELIRTAIGNNYR